MRSGLNLGLVGCRSLQVAACTLLVLLLALERQLLTAEGSRRNIEQQRTVSVFLQPCQKHPAAGQFLICKFRKHELA
jgi:hypothetical protein